MTTDTTQPLKMLPIQDEEIPVLRTALLTRCIQLGHARDKALEASRTHEASAHEAERLALLPILDRLNVIETGVG